MNANAFTIKSTRGYYDVEFHREVKAIDERVPQDSSDFYLVVDAKVWQLYGPKLKVWQNLPIFQVEATEESKTLAAVQRLSDWLVSHRATKTSTIVGFGGGIVQDLVTFTASIFHRGCNWVYYPTTLLSQSDSCIGSKCGINVLPHKNQLGSIYAPQRVVIVDELLQSLPKEEIVSGYGEIFKLSITGKQHFYSLLKSLLSQSEPQLPQGSSLQSIISLSLQAKKSVIEEDELESGPRRVLNLGHSFGHALESLSGYEISHGRAIVFGMDLINYLGVSWGLTNREFASEFRGLLKRYFGSFIPSNGISANGLIEELKSDKKMAHGVMHFAIPRVPGVIEIVPKELDSALVSLVDQYLKDECVFFTS